MRGSFLPVMVLATCAWLPTARAEEPAPRGAPEPVRLVGAPMVVTPPTGDWTRHVDVPAPGQWAVSYRRDDGRTVVQAMLFPVREGPPPALPQLLRQAVDTMFQSLGIAGFGMGAARTLDLMGHAGAEADVQARWRGRAATGFARILRASDAHWAFAWGLTPAGATASREDDVRRFVQSLAPTRPAFLTPTFFDPGALDREVLRLPDGRSVQGRHLAAMRRLIEAALEAPLSLGRRAQLAAILREDLLRGPDRIREGVLLAPEAFARHADLSEAEQQRRQGFVGHRIHHGYVGRWVERDVNATRFVELWKAARRPVATADKVVLRHQHADNLLELAAFLASLARDVPTTIDLEARARLLAHLEARWPSLDEAGRRAWRDAPATWLRLRWRWDQATPAQRDAFRRAVVNALDDAGSELPEEPAALHAWLHARPPLDVEAFARRVADLAPETRNELMTVIGADAGRVPLGW